MLLSVFISYSKKENAIIIVCERKFGAFFQKYAVHTCYLKYVFIWLHIFYCISYNNEAGIEKTCYGANTYIGH